MDLLGDDHRARRGDVAQRQREDRAAVTHHDVGAAQDALQQFDELAQHGVARAAAGDLVDVLQLSQLHEQQRDGARHDLRAFELGAQRGLQLGAARQAGHRIGEDAVEADVGRRQRARQFEQRLPSAGQIERVRTLHEPQAQPPDDRRRLMLVGQPALRHARRRRRRCRCRRDRSTRRASAAPASGWESGSPRPPGSRASRASGRPRPRHRRLGLGVRGERGGPPQIRHFRQRFGADVDEEAGGGVVPGRRHVDRRGAGAAFRGGIAHVVGQPCQQMAHLGSNRSVSTGPGTSVI